MRIPNDCSFTHGRMFIYRTFDFGSSHIVPGHDYNIIYPSRYGEVAKTLKARGEHALQVEELERVGSTSRAASRPSHDGDDATAPAADAPRPVEYFDERGRPHRAEAVPLTAAGIAQARAVGDALHRQRVRIDRALSSGLMRTDMTLAEVLQAGAYGLPSMTEPGFQEIRGGRLSTIPEAELRAAFLAAFEGPVPEATRFLEGETIAQLLDRVLPALERLLADPALAHRAAGRARRCQSGHPVVVPDGNAQLSRRACPGPQIRPNIIDVGPTAARSVVRVVNFCPPDPLRGDTRQSTMEELLVKYLKSREGSAPP